MTQKNILIAVGLLVIAAVAGCFFFYKAPSQTMTAGEESPAPSQGKLDMDAVCQSALAYMSFPDAASAEVFLEECKEGKHPEVIEQYKAQMGLGEGAAI